MNISLSGLHLETDPKIKDYADKKVKKLLNYHSGITDIKVRLISQKAHRNEQHEFFCEITVHVPGKVLEIVDREKDHMKAVDKAVERMKKAIIRYKEKTISKQHHEGIFTKIISRIRR